jgi:hypothetical protein
MCGLGRPGTVDVFVLAVGGSFRHVVTGMPQCAAAITGFERTVARLAGPANE